MRFLIAYDICDPKRLRRVAKVCQDYGLRMQKSVFECRISSKLLREMMQRLESEIDPKADCITGIPICAACNAGRLELGVQISCEIPDVWVA